MITRCILKILHFIYHSAMSLSALVGIKPDTLRQWMTVLARPFLHLWFFKNPRPLSLNHFKVYWRPSWLILDWITGKYELGTTRIMEHLVHPGMTVVDIGANIGYYVFAMKPDERNQVSILFLKPERLEFAVSLLGGTWQQVDEYKPPRMGFLGTRWNMGFLSDLNYHLAVYRRISDR